MMVIRAHREIDHLNSLDKLDVPLDKLLDYPICRPSYILDQKSNLRLTPQLFSAHTPHHTLSLSLSLSLSLAYSPHLPVEYKRCLVLKRLSLNNCISLNAGLILWMTLLK